MADLVYDLALVRQRRNIARLNDRTIRIVQGEDVQLAITVWDKDTDLRPADTSSTDAWLTLVRDRDWAQGGLLTGHDYGWGAFCGGYPSIRVQGTVPQTGTDADRGRINVGLSAAVTAALGGRYRFILQANSQSSVTVLAQGILDVEIDCWAQTPLLVPVTLAGSGAIGELSIGYGGIGNPSGLPSVAPIPVEFFGADGLILTGSDGVVLLGFR